MGRKGEQVVKEFNNIPSFVMPAYAGVRYLFEVTLDFWSNQE
jgi:hypothetical protein